MKENDYIINPSTSYIEGTVHSPLVRAKTNVGDRAKSPSPINAEGQELSPRERLNSKSAIDQMSLSP